MRILKLRLALLLSLVFTAMIILAGCGSSSPTSAGGGGGGTPTTGVLTGYTTDSKGGTGVASATVSVQGTALTGTTNASGGYTINNVPPGTYNLLVSKAGLALSQAQGVVVTNNTTTTANVVVMPLFNPAWSTASAPAISITGITSNGTYTGNVNYTINATGANAIKSISFYKNGVAINSAQDAASLTGAWNTVVSPNGPCAIGVVAYDINGNRTETGFNVTLNNAVTGTLPMATIGYADAKTFGKSLKLFALQQSNTAQTQGKYQSPSQIVLPARHGMPSQIVSIMTAPANSSIFTSVYATAAASATQPVTGFKLYGSNTAGGPFNLIATKTAYSLNASGTAYATSIDDFDPNLQVGVPKYYRVAAYNSAGEGPQSAVISATPLPPFRVNLASPANNASGVVTVPTFAWTPNSAVGQFQDYFLTVWGKNDPAPVWSWVFVGNATSAAYNFDGLASIPTLKNLTVYQWNIDFAEGYNLDANGNFTAESFCGDYTYQGAANGAFYFTTQ